MNEKCSKLGLEQYFTGELDEQQAQEIKQHLADCTECSAYIAGLETEKADFLHRHPFASFTRAHAPVKTIPWYRQFVRSAFRPALIPVYGALVVTVVLLPMINRETNRLSPDVRFKGRNPVSFLYRRDGTVNQGSTTMKFRTGDNIQVVFSIEKDRYVSLLSVDSLGRISFYHPDQQSAFCSIHASAGQKQSFPGSIVLDDTPGSELVIVLFSEKPVSVKDASSWVKRHFNAVAGFSELKNLLGKEGTTLSADVSTLLLRKE
jgi:hypothetical protein